MKKITVDFNKLVLFFLYLLLWVFIINGYAKLFDVVLRENYMVYMISYFIMSLLLIIVFVKNEMDILEPIVFISVIYITMFTIIPMYDIAKGQIVFFDVNLSEFAIKGTIIALLGYISFWIGYTISIKKKRRESFKENKYNVDKIIKLTLIIWSGCFIISVLYLVLTGGYNLSYILTGGLIGNVNKLDTATSPLGIMSMFSYSLVPTCLIYSEYGKSKMSKVLIFFLTAVVQYIRGFRFILIILLLSYIYIYYIKRKKRPTINVLVFSIIGAIVLIGVMEFARGAVRTGGEIKWHLFDSEVILEAVFGNFRIYNSFYAVIKSVPDIIPYLYGGQMIVYTLVMFVPRIIWSNKPYPKVNEPIRIGISEYAAKAGQAYPGIGEYYYDFGILGVVIIMWLFGYIMRKIKQKYLLSRTDKFGIIKYSIIVPTTLQLIIRGYTPSNFYLIIFLILPIIIIKKLSTISIQQGVEK